MLNLSSKSFAVGTDSINLQEHSSKLNQLDDLEANVAR